MEPEPAFSSNAAAAWPLAGSGAWPLERDDPDFAIPRGSLKLCPRDLPEKPFVAGTNPELAVPAEPLATPSSLAEHKRKWTAAIAVSCILHVAVAMAFFVVPDDSVLIEGADEAGIMLPGNAPQDQQAAGDASDNQPDATNVTLVTMLDARPVETVEAQAVTATDTLQPVEEIATEAPAERLEPVQEAALQPDTMPERIEPTEQEPAQAAPADPLPEILATDVQQPTPDDVVVPRSAPVEVVAPDMAEVEPTEKIAGEPVPTPAVKPEPEPEVKKPAKQKTAAPEKKETPQPRKQVAKASKAKAGSGGRNQADARRGAAGGEAEGTTAAASKGRSQSAAGNAAVSNYPGKVAVKLRRAVRGISRSARSKARQDVQVAFVISAAGGVGGVRIVKSSGSPELDEAALATVHRAAPFPPIPSEAGRSNWAFTLPLGVR